ncbi:conjugal transfer protein TraM [Salmonella enterica subsp. enterica serovar Heidelberg]|nr:conjugal transfer protein TraM [Salmonella enterica subsp. enterica serovar Heidelberg]EEK2418838.1 conjugal transfer protein TraM [Salmonella enterica subsp. enterica serovar Heidelberg]EGC2886899.1 conjugal transfer protein TraM [Salmonella enterica subsp. enterica serovar Give]
MIPIDELRKEVAIRHNVLLGPDDPILVTVTINELILTRYLDLASEQYAEANRALTVSLQQQVEQSKETAGKVITEAANYVRDQVRQAVTSAVTEAGAQLRQSIADVQAASRTTETNSRDAQTAKTGAIIAAAVASVAALAAVAALVVVLLK